MNNDYEAVTVSINFSRCANTSFNTLRAFRVSTSRTQYNKNKNNYDTVNPNNNDDFKC